MIIMRSLKVLAVAAGLLMLPGAVRADDAQPDPAVAVLEKSAAMLIEEVLAAVNGGEAYRDKSDYFKREGKADAADLTPESVVMALNTQIHPSPAVDAYVKWQLLSAIEGQFPDEGLPGAVNAYLNAPQLSQRPGGTQQEQQQLDQQLRQMLRNASPAQVSANWEQHVQQQTAGNDIVTDYRTELYNKLPPSAPMLRAALQDAYQRAEAGEDVNSFVKRIIGDAKVWAASGAAPGDVQAIAQLMFELNGYSGRNFYSSVSQERNKAPKWNRVYRNLGGKDELSETAFELQRLSQTQQGGGLQIR
jgi:hypothetical protein